VRYNKLFSFYNLLVIINSTFSLLHLACDETYPAISFRTPSERSDRYTFKQFYTCIYNYIKNYY